MNNPSNKKISVIITAYNIEKYIAEAIKSVLVQTVSPVEIIVIDDGSTDATKNIVASFGSGIKYVYQGNAGAAAARNKGVSSTTGDYIAFLDGDDMWLEEKLKKQIQALSDTPDIQMVFTQLQNFYSPELSNDVIQNMHAPMHPIDGYTASTILIQKQIFFDVGYFKAEYDLGEFIDWYSKAQEKGLQGYCIPEVLVKRRLHKTNQGIRKQHSRKDYLTIIRAKLARQKNKSHQ